MSNDHTTIDAEPLARFAPHGAWTGDRVVFRFRDRLPGRRMPVIRIGHHELAFPIVINASTILGKVPPLAAGAHEVSIEVDGRTVTLPRRFEHRGHRHPVAHVEPAPNAPEARPHVGPAKVRSAPKQGAAGKPVGGSNWWTKSANLYADANGHATVLGPLSVAWEQPIENLNTSFWLTEAVLSEDTAFSAPCSSYNTTPLIALDRATGATRWQWTPDPGSSMAVDTPPVVDGRRLYVARVTYASGQSVGPVELLCADATDGTVLWSAPLEASEPYSNACLVAAFGCVYAFTFQHQGGQGSLRAFDETGALLWQQLDIMMNRTLPYVPDATIAVWDNLVLGTSAGLRAFDPQSGTPVWSSLVNLDLSGVQVMAVSATTPGASSLIIVSEQNSNIHAVATSDGTPVWTYGQNPPGSGGLSACRLAHDNDLGRIYATLTHAVVALDPVSGLQLDASPVLGDLGPGGTICRNRFYQPVQAVGGAPLSVVALDPANLRTVVETFAAQASFFARPVVEGGQMFLNTTTDPSSGEYDVVQALVVPV